jgi:hypothetical protein
MAKATKKIRSVAGLTSKDWAKVHAKAWLDEEFRKRLETDPTRAIEQFGREVGKKFRKIVSLRPRPAKAIRDDRLHHVHPFPPSCC